MLAFSCVAIGIVCVAVIARRAIANSQTNAPLSLQKNAVSAMRQIVKKHTS